MGNSLRRLEGIWRNLVTAVKNMTVVFTPTAVNNTYTIDLSMGYCNFAITSSDANAKTIAFANIPATVGTVIQMIVKLISTTASDFTYPANVTWRNNLEPEFESGKRYTLIFMSYDNGTSWDADCVRW